MNVIDINKGNEGQRANSIRPGQIVQVEGFYYLVKKVSFRLTDEPPYKSGRLRLEWMPDYKPEAK